MKTPRVKIQLSFLIILLLTSRFPAFPQSGFAPKEVTGESVIELSVRNVIQTTDRALEFDIYLLDVNANNAFELATIQAGLLINSSIFAGGTMTVSLVQGKSTLNTGQSPEITGFVNEISGNPGLSLIKLASRGASGTGNGTIISVNGYGECVAHMRLVSTVPFASNTYANLAFTSGTALRPFYATRVAQYISSENVQLAITPGENAIVTENPLLNPVITGTGDIVLPGSSEYPENNEMAGIKIFSYDKAVVIENPMNLKGEVAVFDISGKEISYQVLSGPSRMLIPVQAEGSTYIVHVITSVGTTNAKVIIR